MEPDLRFGWPAFAVTASRWKIDRRYPIPRTSSLLAWVAFAATALGAGTPALLSPATSAGVIAPVNAPLALPFQLKIGGVQAATTFAGLLANTIGLYQINAIIPPVAPGGQSIEFIVDGVANNQNLFITIGN